MERFLSAEIASQPASWRRAAGLAGRLRELLPPGRIALTGCGTSYYMAQTIAALWEGHGLGQADAFAASEMPVRRDYACVVVISRSGTTTELLDLLDRLGDVNTLALAGSEGPVTARTTEAVLFDFADERSVVQTRFATSVVAAFRALAGDDVEALARQAELHAVEADVTGLPAGGAAGVTGGGAAGGGGAGGGAAGGGAAGGGATGGGATGGGATGGGATGGGAVGGGASGGGGRGGAGDGEQRFVFLGVGAAVGLAHEAALKLREAAQVVTESYPAMEYRHGPIALAQPGVTVWLLGPAPEGLTADVAATGADVVDDDLDPLVDLVRVHRLAAALAAAKGLDADHPRHLTRAVLLT